MITWVVKVEVIQFKIKYNGQMHTNASRSTFPRKHFSLSELNIFRVKGNTFKTQVWEQNKILSWPNTKKPSLNIDTGFMAHYNLSNFVKFFLHTTSDNAPPSI